MMSGTIIIAQISMSLNKFSYLILYEKRADSVLLSLSVRTNGKYINSRSAFRQNPIFPKDRQNMKKYQHYIVARGEV